MVQLDKGHSDTSRSYGSLWDQVGNEDEGKGLRNLPGDPEHMPKILESKRDTKTEEYIVKYETRKDKDLNTSGL